MLLDELNPTPHPRRPPAHHLHDQYSLTSSTVILTQLPEVCTCRRSSAANSLSREDIDAYRRDVTTGLYGGDVSRKKKGTGQTSKGHFGSHFGPRTRLKACGPSLLEKLYGYPKQAFTSHLDEWMARQNQQNQQSWFAHYKAT